MDRGAWQATVHRVARVGHDLVTKERQRERDTYDNDIIKDPDTGKDWTQEEKGMTKDKMVG